MVLYLVGSWYDSGVLEKLLEVWHTERVEEDGSGGREK